MQRHAAGMGCNIMLPPPSEKLNSIIKVCKRRMGCSVTLPEWGAASRCRNGMQHHAAGPLLTVTVTSLPLAMI